MFVFVELFSSGCCASGSGRLVQGHVLPSSEFNVSGVGRLSWLRFVLDFRCFNPAAARPHLKVEALRNRSRLGMKMLNLAGQHQPIYIYICLCMYDCMYVCMCVCNGMERNGMQFNVMSCHVMSCHVMSCHVMSCNVI